MKNNNKKKKINHQHRFRRLQKLQLLFVLILLFAIFNSYKTSILLLSTSKTTTTTTTTTSFQLSSSSDSFSKGSTSTSTSSTSTTKLDVVESSSNRILRFDNNTSTNKISSSISRSFYVMENVWNEYKSYHSIDVLRQEQEQQDNYNNSNNNIKRKYQVIYYTCPQVAGNYLHDIYNQVIIAIATNRTMLWKYYNNETCWEVVTKQQSPKKVALVKEGDCPMGGGIKPNTIHDCNSVLIKKSWIPSYDEWVPKLLIQQQQNTTTNTTTTSTTTSTTTKEQKLINSLLPKRQGGTKATIEWSTSQINAFKAMIFPQPLYRHQQFLNSTISITTIAESNQTNTTANSILEKLYSNGSQILYGMLFRKLFDINPNILLPSSTSSTSSTSTTTHQQQQKSYALHSRHIFPSDNGSNIKNEMNCLETVLLDDDEDHPQKSSSSCIIYLMSDRDLNRQLVANYIRSEYPYCIPILPTHHNNNTTQETTTQETSKTTKTNLEHGTNAGGGFFQDIAIATNARDGFIGTCSRTSSYLIEEIIQYDRTKEFVLLMNKGSSSLSLPPFKTCCLPNDETARKKLQQQRPKPRRQT